MSLMAAPLGSASRGSSAALMSSLSRSSQPCRSIGSRMRAALEAGLRSTAILSFSLTLLLAGCSTGAPAVGASPTPAPSPSVQVSPAASGTALLAVVEARTAPARYGTLPGAGDSYDTVAIAGYDGFARSRATFKPRAIPVLPGGGTPFL